MNAELLPERFAEQAFRTPHAVAVVAGGRAVTYEELDRVSGRVARCLRELGAGPETPVGVALPRGVDLVVALLGVWRAGAAYVPLDPAQPAARLAGLLRDSGAELVLAGREAAAAVAEAGARRLDPGALPDPARPDAPLPVPAADPGGAAYAVFTSGSTGRPKAVVVTHAGIAGRVGWTVERHGLGPGDRVLQKTTIGFDAAAWEIFAPLVSGATVVLAPAGAERDPAALLAAVAAHGITVLQVVPSVLRLLVAEGAAAWAGCGALRLLFSAGEPLHFPLVARVRELAGAELEVWNTYGPTECSIDATAHPVETGPGEGPVPIGRPLPGMRALVLDPAGAPVPVGVPGELHVGGAGVARGYAGRPELTAERFVPDPYATVPGDRLYRTGDQVRWRADRTLEYLGRLDHQVKVNGVRIEPGEIEAALTAHPAVTGAVVTAYEADGDGDGGGGGKRLAAHVTAGGDVDAAGLRAFLAGRLPESHVPSVFRVLEAFPLLPSGKADRAALPDPRVPRAARAPEFTAPRTPAEQLVAGVWAELLGRDRVGAADDFFALGGTSLQLTRLAARLRAASGARLPLRGLFTATTVEAQARLLGPAGEAEPADGDAVVPVRRDGVLPLSSGQRRLWFLDRMHPGSPEWVAPLFLRLPGALPPDAVAAALDALADRHEPLRTRYPAEGGEARQVIDAPGTSRIELRVEESGRAGVAALFAEQFARGFDLAAGPLWRGLLVRDPGPEGAGGAGAADPDGADRRPEGAGADQLLLLTLHHITCDGWSTVLLERELRELCAARLEGRPAVLPELPLQYADYGSWQHARLTEEAMGAELAHWRSVLDGLTPIELPADRPRPAVRDPRGAVVPLRVPPATAAALTALGRAHGATPFMTLLTAYATLVARWSGQWDVPVGTPVAGRTRPETGSMVGFFLNSLVVRCGLGPGVPFTEALERVRDAARDAFAHQELPFERLVDEVQPERDLSRTPLYQVAFDLHSEGVTSVVTRDADLAAFTEAWQVAKTDLSLFMRGTPEGGLDGVLEYAASLFERSTVERMARHFLTLLDAVAADPGTPLGEAELLGAAERHRLTAGLNDTAWAGDGLTVLDRFERHAHATPERTALEGAGRTVRYGELEVSANRLAHHLRTLCVGAESRVAVLLDRGPDLVTALLAVGKASGAYVPVDPGHPAERVAAMCAAAGVRTLVTSAAYADRYAGGGLKVLCLDRDAAVIAARPATAPARTRDPDRLAYVIFTSGSTGTPKGVEVTHRGLANHVAWAVRELAGGDCGGGALFSSIAFDLVVPNVWAPLTSGQRLFLLPQETDLAELGKRLAEAAPFSFLKLTPGHLDILAQQLTPAQAGALAPVAVVAGEPFTRAALTRWRALAPGMRLINEYGPTEASVGTSVYPVPDDGPVPPPDVLPIGRPLPGMTMYVLDPALRPVPVGVAGELYVGGTGVARGYAHRPDLTADRFPPDPYGAVPGARLYRTGDLVRHRPDGNVEFLGRVDDQVKIRGHRVEPGEIRAVVEAHPQVREAVVTVRRPASGAPELACYAVPAGPGAALPDLAAHCAARLPAYMVPATFTALDAIPVNANGKVDRRALPEPVRGGPADGEVPVEPSGPVQERIAAIWTELLGARPSAHDSFFRVGGNSILAIRLISRIQQEFGIDFAVRTVFEGPTVARLAATVEERITAEIAALSDAELLDSVHPTDPAGPPPATPAEPTKEHQA
ncbi:amino acid adenylation domain-containing protein [Streptomyces sp. NPDC093252]|uniref:amino acid adenylation domain-containing protein n=1 Tax=Streptomyces sp. NPDC093252 TaxID=3154980 RepID=UPI003421822F